VSNFFFLVSHIAVVGGPHFGQLKENTGLILLSMSPEVSQTFTGKEIPALFSKLVE